MLFLCANASHFLSGDRTAHTGVSGFSIFAVSTTVHAYATSPHSNRRLPMVNRTDFSSSVSRKPGMRAGSMIVSPANDIAEASRTLSNSGVLVRFAGQPRFS